MMKSESESYKAAGVDITAGYASVELMKKHVARTMTAGCVEGIGGFGGLFALDAAGMEEPVLVSGTDGGIKTLSAGTRACVEQAFALLHTEHLAAYLRSLVLHEKEVLKAQEFFIGDVFRHTDAARRKLCRLGMNSFAFKHFYKFFP